MTALLCAFLFAFGAVNDAVTELTQHLEARYRAAKTLQVTFLERYSENGQAVRVESGEAYFRKPGKMRWEYEKPERDLFVVDGKTAWFYVPGDHTVTRIPARQSTDLRTPLALLAGEMKLSRICARVEISDAVKPQAQGNAVLRCVLRAEREARHNRPEVNPSASDQVFFEVTGDRSDLARIIVKQPGGIEAEFCFQHWQFDPPVAADLFRFAPPPGVAIVNGELPPGENNMNTP